MIKVNKAKLNNEFEKTKNENEKEKKQILIKSQTIMKILQMKIIINKTIIILIMKIVII